MKPEQSTTNGMAASAIHDADRIAALHQLGLLDSPNEETFDRLTRLAARILAAPIALVSLVDTNRQFFKSSLGLEEPWASRRETPLSHSFCQYVVALKQPLVVADARLDPLLQNNLAVRDLNVIAYAGIPLITSDGQALGAFCVIDSHPRHWADEQITTLGDLAALVVTEFELRRAIGENIQLLEDLQRLSMTDGLTNVYNRRGLFELGARELERAHRTGAPLIGLMLDVDHFKQVNDSHGHPVGDQVLRGVAERCRNTIREIDLIGRYGGEEFAILLNGSEQAVGPAIAERLRQRIANTPFTTSAGELWLTISIGVAESTDATTHLTSLLSRADQALYRAKQAGRNCVVCEDIGDQG